MALKSKHDHTIIKQFNICFKHGHFKKYKLKLQNDIDF